MVKKTYTVTGLPVEAEYSDREVEELFVPLLNTLVKLRKDQGKRVIAFLSAPPGSGKTTLSLFLEDLFKERHSDYSFQSISMDGFHQPNRYLDRHTINREGKEQPLRQYKGIPESFDAEKLAERITALTSHEEVEWPTYDRLLHDVSDRTEQVAADIVLIEGNYLLLDKPVWRNLKALSDYTIAINASMDELEERLVERKQKGGAIPEEAYQHVLRTDKPNADLVLNYSQPADLTLTLKDGKFKKS